MVGVYTALEGLLKHWWRYDGAHKKCNHCGNSALPGVPAILIQHDPHCAFLAAQMALATLDAETAKPDTQAQDEVTALKVLLRDALHRLPTDRTPGDADDELAQRIARVLEPKRSDD